MYSPLITNCLIGSPIYYLTKMLFNPFSLCYGRSEREDTKCFSKMEKEIQRLASKNDIHVCKKNVTNCNDDYINGRAKFIGSVNISKVEPSFKMDKNKSMLFSRKFSEMESKLVKSANFVDGKGYQRISNIPPIIVPNGTIKTDLNGIDQIVDKLTELEDLMKNILNKFEMLELGGDSIEDFKTMNEIQVDKIVTEKVRKLLSSSSMSLEGSSSKLSTSQSNLTETNDQTIKLPIPLDKLDSKVENGKKAPRQNNTGNESNEFGSKTFIRVDNPKLRLTEDSTGTNNINPPCLDEQFQHKYIDDIMCNVDENISNHYIEKKIEIDRLRDWAYKCNFDNLGIDDIYSFEESNELLTRNMEIENAHNLALESNIELPNIEISDGLELALEPAHLDLKCGSKAMASIDLSDNSGPVVVSMTSFSSISKLESLSIESNLSVLTN